MHRAEQLLDASAVLNRALARMRFAAPVAHVYNPLHYALAPYTRYVRTYATTRKRVLFLGMNPGPFGMAQTGVPFGEVGHVRDWLGIEAEVVAPKQQHPKRPVLGFACTRSEVSGARLWGMFKARYGTPERLFAWAFVDNYCPLVFMEASGRNITPDKLPASERDKLFRACDARFAAAVRALEPEWVVGVGKFAEGRAKALLSGSGVRIGAVLHPSPASPGANRGWAEQALAELRAQGVPLDA